MNVVFSSLNFTRNALLNQNWVDHEGSVELKINRPKWNEKTTTLIQNRRIVKSKPIWNIRHEISVAELHCIWDRLCFLLSIRLLRAIYDGIMHPHWHFQIYTSVRIILNRLTHRAHTHTHTRVHAHELLQACVHVYVSKKKKKKHSNSISDFVYGQSKPFVALCVLVNRLQFAFSISSPHTIHANVMCKTNFYLLWS